MLLFVATLIESIFATRRRKNRKIKRKPVNPMKSFKLNKWESTKQIDHYMMISGIDINLS